MPQATRGASSIVTGPSTLLRSNQRGASAIEYALLIALIAIAGTAAFALVGQRSQQAMDKVEANLSSSNSLTIPPPPKP